MLVDIIHQYYYNKTTLKNQGDNEGKGFENKGFKTFLDLVIDINKSAKK